MTFKVAAKVAIKTKKPINTSKMSGLPKRSVRNTQAIGSAMLQKMSKENLRASEIADLTLDNMLTCRRDVEREMLTGC